MDNTIRYSGADSEAGRVVAGKCVGYRGDQYKVRVPLFRMDSVALAVIWLRTSQSSL